MSTPTLFFGAAETRRPDTGYLRLRVKPADRTTGCVQGAWWPRTDQLSKELVHLIAAVEPRVGSVDRVVYDENTWAPESLRLEFKARSIILEGSGDSSTHTVSVYGDRGRMVLLVVPPYTSPTRAYTTVMTASKPDDVSTPDELLGIGPKEAQDRRFALMAHQRWESEGGAPRPVGRGRRGVGVGHIREVRHAQ